MKAQICNNCGNTLSILDKGHIFEGKVVCSKCIKILAPGRPKQKVDLARVFKEARGRVTVQMAADEDIRYEKAKRRVVFFLSGLITFFWIIVLLHLLVIAAVSVAVITGFGG